MNDHASIIPVKWWGIRHQHSRSRDRRCGALIIGNEDGTYGISSPIVAINGRIVRTRNTVYRLVGPPMFPHWFAGPDDNPLSVLGPNQEPFYLDVDGPDAAWPPGSTPRPFNVE